MYSYIHIPFCESKCKYCRFASLWSLQEARIKKYVSYLLKEIKDKSRLYSLDLLKSIYFWWWTPSTLNIEQLEQIISLIRTEIWFHDNIEISLESTPNNVTRENLIWWKKLWINRLSLWVQTLNEKSLTEIWRWNKGDIFKALDNIKDIWFENVSLDFIIWLPYVGVWEIKRDIEYILNKYNFLKHISVYMLEEYYSPDKIIETKFDKITYPQDWSKMWISEDEYLWEYIKVNNFLEKRWFNRYEISNFAKNSHDCKHNKAYWNHKEVIAFWLWASWFLNWTRYTNSDYFNDYYAWKKLFTDKLTQDDIFLEKLMFGLRTSWIWKDIFDKLDKDKIDYFLENWYLKFENDILTLDDKWILVMDYILKELV